MLHSITRNWLAIVLRGVAAIVFGLLALFMPGITLFALVFLFGVYALLDGVINLIGFFRTGIRDHWPLLLEGVVGILAGILAFVWPHITALVLVYLIGFWAIFTGILELVAALRLWKVLGHEWLLLLSGIASLAFGFFVFAVPLAGALAIVIWIGFYAILFGALLVSFGLRLRHRHHGSVHPAATPRPA